MKIENKECLRSRPQSPLNISHHRGVKCKFQEERQLSGCLCTLLLTAAPSLVILKETNQIIQTYICLFVCMKCVDSLGRWTVDSFGRWTTMSLEESDDHKAQKTEEDK
jgi:hypothetical protein